jgi:hypothetical protein
MTLPKQNLKVPRVATSCRSCLAWGVPSGRDLCRACLHFAMRPKLAGDCAACGRCELLKTGYCRLCWAQAALERPKEQQRAILAPYLCEVGDQQLFLAVWSRRRKLPRNLSRRPGVKSRPLKPPAPVAGRPRVSSVQLQLFVVPRHYCYRRVDPRGIAPKNPWLAWALHLARTMAEARGFPEIVRRDLNRTLAMLLAEPRDV